MGSLGTNLFDDDYDDDDDAPVLGAPVAAAFSGAADDANATADLASSLPARSSSAMSWSEALQMIRRSRQRYIIVDVKNGLGNRLRALASAMSLGAHLNRPVLLVWVPDLHLNCSFSVLFSPPLPVQLVDEEVSIPSLSGLEFQVFNYMPTEPGANKGEEIEPDPDRHLFVRSAFMLNHPMGEWKSGGPHKQLLRFVPVPEVRRQLIADGSMVGLHVRNVFDAPRDPSSNVHTEGAAAIDSATREYGRDNSVALLRWRRASHWSNFVPKIQDMVRLRELARGLETAADAGADAVDARSSESAVAALRRTNASSGIGLRFYLAADAESAYDGLAREFPGRILATRRTCAATRCDFRDCGSMLYSLIDLMNLARTRLILGSGYSSYSEVAAQLGGDRGHALPILMAGRDFGTIVPPDRAKAKEDKKKESRAAEPERVDLAGFGHEIEDGRTPLVQRHWPRPF